MDDLQTAVAHKSPEGTLCVRGQRSPIPRPSPRDLSKPPAMHQLTHREMFDPPNQAARGHQLQLRVREGPRWQGVTGSPPLRVHDGKVAVEKSDQRYCSDGFEIGCDNGEKVRVTFSLDCCDRQAIAFAATTAGISGELVRDVMVQTMLTRFGAVEQMPTSATQWLSDNGSGYIAKDTRQFASDLGLIACRTPFRSPQSNGMAEAFVKTIKRDYASVNPTPDGPTVLEKLVEWFADYNTVHPHSALKYRSPNEFREENDLE